MNERLPAPWGTLLDRRQSVTFTFEGERVQGYAGDTVSSALLGRGTWLQGRSFKYHRPRGPFTLVGDDANCLVQLPEEPNCPAEHIAAADGLDVRGQHYSGSLRRDRARFMEKFSRFFFVGFYYRAFYRPRGIWDYWERLIRRAAGLGRVNQNTAHRYRDKQYAFCDVAVIGSGAAGLAAALAAADAGADTVLIEREPLLGGGLNYHRFDAEGTAGAVLRGELLERAEHHERIRVYRDTQCTGRFGDNLLALVHEDRMTKLRADRVVVATGAIGQPAVFRYNDLPGIATGSGVQRLMRLYGVKPGRRAVCITANGDGYGVALDLADAGVEVAAVVDLRERPAADPRADAIRERGIAVHPDSGIVHAVERDQHVAGLRITRRNQAEHAGAPGTDIECDLVTVDVGATPAISQVAHAGGDVSYSSATHGLTIRQLPPGLHVAGSVAGPCSLDAARAEGEAAGRAAATDGNAVLPVPTERDGPGNDPWPIFAHPKGKEFVDFDEDLTIADLRNAVREGFDSIELVKRFSTVGMGPSQGRTAAVNAVRITADQLGESVEGARASTNRPPAIPERFGHLAGRGFDPVRYTPMHRRHVDAGATMMVAGAWLRPAYYGRDGKAAVREEVRAVRENVGMIDVTTLGGLEIRGPDAVEFMNRMYTFAYRKQPVNRSRYLLMTDDTGSIVDDGVAARWADDHFYVTATTGGVDSVYRRMLWWNAQWRLDVDIANVTGAWAGINIAGPNARTVIEHLDSDIDFSAEAFPYIEARSGHLADIPVRVLRVGFVGELGYEVHCPAGCAEALWDRLMEAGRAYGIRPFGVEAQRVLRLEKGHIIIGQDTDNLTHPEEASMGWAVQRKKPFFVGFPALKARESQTLTRRLVGFRLPADTDPLPEECHLVIDGDRITGRVTSIAYSPTLEYPIGLAFVDPERTEPGTPFTIKGSGGTMIEAEVCAAPFFDPDNERQNL
ncbi:MAG: 2Fe-2S iron-sulfur cluster-binding protein [Halofilum sp. (in: g-proteobacteria)]